MAEVGWKYSDCGYGPRFYQWLMTDNHEPYGCFGNDAATVSSEVFFLLFIFLPPILYYFWGIVKKNLTINVDDDMLNIWVDVVFVMILRLER